MKLILNGDVLEVDTPSADMSALQFVRETLKLTGTKEGCASGDCGACTLLVGSLEDGALRYQTLNSCITPIQALDGKHVVTVEHLASESALHPAQHAMVECHGSQCGFCTPGFVMSLTALYEEASQDDSLNINRHSVSTAISGNLCRCTGYRPIIDAGLSMQEQTISTKLGETRTAVSELLQSFSPNSAKPKNYFIPKSQPELHALIEKHHDAQLISGGTDLMLESTQRYKDIPELIDVSQVIELTEIQENDQDILIGAAVTYSQLEDFFQSRSQPFYELIDRIASKQIRNRGTIGGNIANASPIADLPPALISLEAQVWLSSSSGNIRKLKLEDFYLGYKKTTLKPKEYITHIQFPQTALNDFHRFYKVSKRFEDDISSVMLAIRFETSGHSVKSAYISFGGMAATPIRATSAESAFNNQNINTHIALGSAVSAIKTSLTPMTDVRASAQYRIEVACKLLEKAWLELGGEKIENLGSVHSEVF